MPKLKILDIGNKNINILGYCVIGTEGAKHLMKDTWNKLFVLGMYKEFVDFRS